MIWRYGGRICGNILRIAFDALLFSIFLFFFSFLFHSRFARFISTSITFAPIFILAIFIPFVSIRSDIPFVSIFQKNILFVSFDSKNLSISNKMKTGGAAWPGDKILLFLLSIPIKTRRVNYYWSRKDRKIFLSTSMIKTACLSLSLCLSSLTILYFARKVMIELTLKCLNSSG